MSKRGKNYRNALALLQSKEFYTAEEAIKLMQEGNKVKFDATAELHLKLNVDPKQADQMIRATVVLPHGTGRKVRVAAIVTDDKVKAAKAAGADAAGLEELIAEFEKGKVDYDVIVAIPEVVKELGKVAKTLGQKGLMPNSKSGTITPKFEEAIKDLKRGRIELRTDKEGNLHTVFGKLSFKPEELHNNLLLALKTIRDAKPAGVKGSLINTITITSTMGPGIKLDLAQTLSSLSR